MKLTRTQLEVLRAMRDGWELKGFQPVNIKRPTRYYLERRGEQDIRVSYATYYSLCQVKKLITYVPRASPFDMKPYVFQLTDAGREVLRQVDGAAKEEVRIEEDKAKDPWHKQGPVGKE